MEWGLFPGGGVNIELARHVRAVQPAPLSALSHCKSRVYILIGRLVPQNRALDPSHADVVPPRPVGPKIIVDIHYAPEV